MCWPLSLVVAVLLVLAGTPSDSAPSAPAASPAAREQSAAVRPVVLVHGFTASAASWSDYVGPDGFLAGIGVVGFAVGDPGVGPAMDMGRITSPTAETGTIAQNAAVLASVIDEVKRQTGAPLVDVVAHSMGGLVARYYLARLMDERDVGQLLLLGVPSLGSPCAALPSALGFYVPAALELRPSYLAQVFNPQVADTGGVPVEALAGTPITERFRSSCTDVPSDLVVDLDSVAGAGAPVVELAVLHTHLTHSRDVFEQFVAPRLLRPPADLEARLEPAVEHVPEAQATHVYTGTVAPGSTTTIDIDLDAVAVAGFALFDPSRSLAVRVRGASGAEILLTTEAHGLFTVDDPTSLVHLGYGFAAPRPGPWSVTLVSGPGTPAGGAPFALTAWVVGGASVEASVDEFLPTLGEPVVFEASLRDIDQNGARVTAVVTAPTGVTSSRAMERTGDTWHADWRPEQVGVHGIDVIVSGTSAGGLAVERTASLAVEVRAAAPRRWVPVAAGTGLILLVAIGLTLRYQGRGRRRV